MKSETPLSEMYILYVNEGLSKKELEGRMFKYLQGNYDRYRVFNGEREHWSEFLSWLYPRIARAIELYRDMGSSFDAYITGIVHGSAREYRYRDVDHQVAESVWWQARAVEMTIAEREPEYDSGDTEERKELIIPEGINSKQILVLLLKSYYFVSEEFVNRVAKAIGMENQVIHDMIGKLRDKRSEKEAAVLDLRERLHGQYYRCLTYQKRMNTAQPGTDYYEKMKDRFERAKKRFYTMKKRLKGMPLSASNRMIAEVLGVPRGTVDSCLFTVKNRRPVL